MIPRVIHRIWLGSDLPEALSGAANQWRAYFPDYEMKLWDDRSLTQLGMPRHWFSAQTYAERSDIARYELLWRFGGIYTDCDVTPLRDFRYLWDDSDRFIAFRESEDLVWNGLVAAAPRHPALKIAAILATRSAKAEDPGAAPNVRTGPFVFTAAITYAQTLCSPSMRIYPCGFAHVRGNPSAHSVVSSPFRDPPAWTKVPPESALPPEVVWTTPSRIRLWTDLAALTPLRAWNKATSTALRLRRQA